MEPRFQASLDGILKSIFLNARLITGVIYSPIYMRGWAVVPAFPDLLAFVMMCNNMYVRFQQREMLPALALT